MRSSHAAASHSVKQLSKQSFYKIERLDSEYLMPAAPKSFVGALATFIGKIKLTSIETCVLTPVQSAPSRTPPMSPDMKVIRLMPLERAGKIR